MQPTGPWKIRPELDSLHCCPLPNYIQPTHKISTYCHSMTFCQIHTGKDFYKYSFFPLAIVQWKALPANVAASLSLEIFKAAVEDRVGTGRDFVPGYPSLLPTGTLVPITITFWACPQLENVIWMRIISSVSLSVCSWHMCAWEGCESEEN